MDKIKISELAEFDLADYLETDEDIANYLTLILQEGDVQELNYALGVIARARGMTEIAKSSGLSREALYKALRVGSKPQFETIFKVLNALNINLQAIPKPVTA